MIYKRKKIIAQLEVVIKEEEINEMFVVSQHGGKYCWCGVELMSCVIPKVCLGG